MPVGSPVAGSFTTCPAGGLFVSFVTPDTFRAIELAMPAGPAW